MAGLGETFLVGVTVVMVLVGIRIGTIGDIIGRLFERGARRTEKGEGDQTG